MVLILTMLAFLTLDFQKMRIKNLGKFMNRVTTALGLGQKWNVMGENDDYVCPAVAMKMVMGLD